MNYKKHYQSSLLIIMLYQICIIIDDRPDWVIFINVISLIINLFILISTFDTK